MELLEKSKEKTFEILEELQTLYQELKNTEMQLKVRDEASTNKTNQRKTCQRIGKVCRHAWAGSD